MADEQSHQYQLYLQQKHNRMKTPDAIINAAVIQAVGHKIVTQQRLVMGEVNEVYDVVTDNGQAIIVRISHRERPRFRQERWAILQCQKVGVPTPKVLLIRKAVDENDKQVCICVEEKLPGEPFDVAIKNETITDTQIKTIVHDVGSIMARIHSIKTIGYGRVNTKGKGHYTSLATYMLSVGRKIDQLQKAFTKAELDSDLALQGIAILREHRRLFVDAVPCLTHGDLGPKHVLIKDGKITGIIDLENAGSNSPFYDFSWWDYYHGQKLPLQWLLEGYADKSLLNDNFELKMRLFRLHKGLDIMIYFAWENNLSGLAHAKQEFLNDFNYFRGGN